MHLSPSDLKTKKKTKKNNIQTRDLNVEIVNHNHMTIYIIYEKKNQMALVRLSSLTKKQKKKQCGVTLWKQVTFFFCTYVHFVLAQNISV